MMKERLSGLFHGAILGDCLGNPHLFMRAAEMAKMANQIGWQPGEMSDESELLLLGLNCYARHGVNYDAWARACHRWVAASPNELDSVMQEVFGTRKVPSAAELWQRSQARNHAAACSSLLLVRQIPLVLASLSCDAATLRERVAFETRLTHDEEMCVEVAQIYALCLHAILRGMTKLEVWDMLMSQIVSPSIYKAVVNAYYAMPCADRDDYSHNAVALQMALHQFWRGTGFVSSIRSAILAGGATDTNAAVTGALLGAYHGVSCIPHAWLDALKDRFPALVARSGDILDVALALCEGKSTRLVYRAHANLPNSSISANSQSKHQDNPRPRRATGKGSRKSAMPVPASHADNG